MDPISFENGFVEKVVLKNNLLPAAKLDEAKAACAKDPTRSLLATLCDMELIDEEKSTQIMKMFEKYKTTQTGMMPIDRPAAAPGIQRIGAAGGAPAPAVQRIGGSAPAAPAASPAQRGTAGSGGSAPQVQRIGAASGGAAPSPASGVQRIGAAQPSAPAPNNANILKIRNNSAAAAPAAPAAPPQMAPSAPAPQPQRISLSNSPSPAPQAQQQRVVAAPEPAPRVTPRVQHQIVPATPMPRDLNQFNHIHHYLEYARSTGASDIHVNACAAPLLRKDGKLSQLPRAPFTAEETEKLLFGMLTPEQSEELEKKKALDFCYTVEGLGRYRSCILKQRVGWDGAFRVINSKVPTFEELGLPVELKRLTEFHQGLVLITGPSGCGKSTTMAAMLDLVNKHREEHIISIEDPVEYVYPPDKCQVNQRELGTCTKSFANALRAALREDPDVIMIGELRDEETVSLAITAAETGHLVFGTLHTTSAGRTIDRILDVFPPEEQGQIRSMISESIKGIICQQLIPRKDGKGRALALEILFNTPAVANLIRERALHKLNSAMQVGRKQGMMMLDDSLAKLLQEGVIEGADAYFAAENKNAFVQYAPKL
jgi:twitching motility protein PilT